MVVPFDQILDAVLRGQVDAGLIIHEGQLTYAASRAAHGRRPGRVVVRHETGLPLPLGGNAIRKDLGAATIAQGGAAPAREHRATGWSTARRRWRYALRRPRPGPRMADRFVGMYVNDLTLDYGERGRKAVRLFLERGRAAGLITVAPQVEFAGQA